MPMRSPNTFAIPLEAYHKVFAAIHLETIMWCTHYRYKEKTVASTRRTTISHTQNFGFFPPGPLVCLLISDL